jgi:Na+/proline symporter
MLFLIGSAGHIVRRFFATAIRLEWLDHKGLLIYFGVDILGVLCAACIATGLYLLCSSLKRFMLTKEGGHFNKEKKGDRGI